jgi:hypothetical protein
MTSSRISKDLKDKLCSDFVTVSFRSLNLHRLADLSPSDFMENMVECFSSILITFNNQLCKEGHEKECMDEIILYFLEITSALMSTHKTERAQNHVSDE